ncbi:Glycosyltransferase [Psidium guajava]|nr:Glycosyltransferase [Psidium guajava]
MKVTEDGEKIDLNHKDRPLNYNKLKEEMGNEEKLRELHSVEFLFKDKEIPPWRSQLTLRAVVVSCAMGAFLTIYVIKMDLMLGVIPPVNLFAGFLGFLLMTTWTKLVSAAGFVGQQFTRQENAVIQICVNAVISTAYNGGFASYLIAMSDIVANQLPEPSNADDIKNPSLGWMTMFLLLSSSAGLLTTLPFQKCMIIDKKLTFPTGSASANFINSFHAPRSGTLNGRRQIKKLTRFFAISFLWSIFQWLYSRGDSCGFTYFPTFGLKAFERSSYFDFYSAYIGIGMMCPFVITYSQMLGAILSSGVLWPYIQTKSGDWYPVDAPTALSNTQAYKVFLGLSIIIGEGVYTLMKIVVIGLIKHKNNDNSSALPTENPFHGKNPVPYDEEIRTKTFLMDQIPKKVASFGYVGYISITMISIAVFTFIYPSLEWYQVLTLYLVSPLLGFCRAYATGLSDMSISMFYKKLVILIFGSWAGKSRGSILVALAACGILLHFVEVASNMMESFKVGYKTLSSPKSLFLSQLIGTLVGCFVSPYVFLYFKNHYPTGFGTPDSVFSASWASSERAAAMDATNGFSTLPKHCLSLSLGFFVTAILVSMLRDSMPKKWKNLIPIPMAFAVPFIVGAYLSINMSIGYLIFYLWRRKNKAQAEGFGPFVGSALMFGDGLWLFPSTVLSMKNIVAPMCMRFPSKGMSAQVKTCLSSGS